MSDGKPELSKKARRQVPSTQSQPARTLPKVGAAAKFVDMHNVSHVGRVQVIDQQNNLIVLEEPKDRGSCKVCILNYKNCIDYKELEGKIEQPKPLRKLDLAKIHERGQKATRHLANQNYMKENKNITPEGVSAFNSLCTIFNEDIIHWEDLNIVVNDTVRICPPYTDSSVERIKDSSSKVSEDTFKRICLLLKKRACKTRKSGQSVHPDVDSSPDDTHTESATS